MRFSKQPSTAVLERMQRALPNSGHRLFLISTKQLAPTDAPRIASTRCQEFTVLGATGNVYCVNIGRQPCCNCPDFVGRATSAVLRVSITNPIVWQRALLPHEVDDALSGLQAQQGAGAALAAAAAGGVLADDRVRSAWQAATGQPGAAAAAGTSSSQEPGRRAADGETCPVCFDDLLKEGAEELVWCRQGCGNIHKACFANWAAARQRTGQTVTCVFCRAVWRGDGAGAGGGGADAAAAAGGASPWDNAYLNLAQHSRQHADADTSRHALYGDRARWIR